LSKHVGTTPLAGGGRAPVSVRAALVSGAALTLIAGLMSAADAAPRGQRYFFFSPSPAFVTPYRSTRVMRSIKRKPRSETAKKTSPERQGFPDIPKGVHQIVISIGTQRVTLFTGGTRVAQGPVSTGTASHPTPLGVFSVIEKDRYHRSNLYGNAPMFFMQRLTWSGVAMHEGPLPGYPASHGCIRLTTDFAARLWATTRLGVRVIVARSELAPVEFSHAALFVPRLKPAEPKVAMNTTTDGHMAPLQVAEAMSPSTDAAIMRDLTAAAPETTDNPGVPKPDEQKAAEPSKPAAETAADPVAPSAAQETPIAPSELRQSVELPTAPEPAAEAAAAPAIPADDGKAVKPVPTVDPLKPPATSTKAADQPAKRKGQVAVFVSRKEKKLFVRQGFIPLFEMPIMIDNPDQPLGTHVFTAMEVTDGGAGMRWNLFTVPSDPNQPEQPRNRKTRGKEPPKPRPVATTKPPSTAAQALDRIHMPQEAVDRIGELLVPGSSLVVSDDGLGRETGRYTEFIVLTR
jgi:lipoprotein-anchoring transpeptidase ErfK/SrfK